jgi:hypothetical protein
VTVDRTDKRTCTATAKSTGQRCKRAPHPGSTVCVKHGAGAPAVRAAAARREADREAARRLRRLLADVDAPPVTDPVGELERLAGQLRAAVDVLGGWVNELPSIRDVDAEGGAHLRAEVALWERLMVSLRKALVEMTRLGIEERRVQISERHGQMLAAGLRWLFAELGMAGDPRLPVLVPAMLRSLAEGRTPEIEAPS